MVEFEVGYVCGMQLPSASNTSKSTGKALHWLGTKENLLGEQEQGATSFFYIFEVYNIGGWSTDGGKKLKDEEKGCGALTGWDWDERTSTHPSRAYFKYIFSPSANSFSAYSLICNITRFSSC
jgi:hypothetical protein